MKPIILTLILVILVTPAVCFGEWIEEGSTVTGNTFHIDYERIREHDGHVYFWMLMDNLKPDSEGFMSGTMYYQVNCDLFRFKRLSMNHYKQPMGKGDIRSTENEPWVSEKKWNYPSPDSTNEALLEEACDYVKLDEEGRQEELEQKRYFLKIIKESEVQ